MRTCPEFEESSARNSFNNCRPPRPPQLGSPPSRIFTHTKIVTAPPIFASLFTNYSKCVPEEQVRTPPGPMMCLSACLPRSRGASACRRHQSCRLRSFTIFREDGVAIRRRIQRFQQVQPPPQITARQLARPCFDVDIATDPMQIQRKRVDERLPDVGVEQRAFALYVLLPPQQRLLRLPAFIVYFAVHSTRRVLLESEPCKRVLRFFGPRVRNDLRQTPVQPVMIFRYVLLFQSKNQHCFVLEADLRRPGLMTFGRTFRHHEIGHAVQIGSASRLLLIYRTLGLPTAPGKARAVSKCAAAVAAREGGRAAIGSSRYSLTTSSLIGADAQKYPNVLLRGITSPRNRSANWPTVTLEGLDGARPAGTGSL